MPHFFKPNGNGRHGSQRNDESARLSGLRRSIASLHELFGGLQYTTNLARAECVSANRATRAQVEILICTRGDAHLLRKLNTPGTQFENVECDCEAPYLGFECQAVLAEHLREFDFFCYLEDDIIINDPWFFPKLTAFTRQAGDDCLLQPNRYEGAHFAESLKAYVDGDLAAGVASRFQDIAVDSEIGLDYLGVRVACRRPANPHSGCFFLNSEQMAHWASQPYFLDRDASFVSPLESAATLGIMKAFKIYKPGREVANFLEVQHYGSALLRAIAARDARWRLLARSDGAPSAPANRHGAVESDGTTCRGESVDVPLHSMDNHVLVKLASDFPWPSVKPPVVPNPRHGWLNASTRELLAKAVADAPRLVVELGSWLGLSTRFIADQAPCATIVAVDHWQGSQEHLANPQLAGLIPTLFETFLVNCWDYRDRLIALRMSSAEGLQLLADRGLAPDVIYVDADHAYESVSADLALARRLFPQALLVGDDWDWQSVRRAVVDFARAQEQNVEAHGGAWMLPASR